MAFAVELPSQADIRRLADIVRPAAKDWPIWICAVEGRAPTGRRFPVAVERVAPNGLKLGYTVRYVPETVKGWEISIALVGQEPAGARLLALVQPTSASPFPAATSPQDARTAASLTPRP